MAKERGGRARGDRLEVRRADYAKLSPQAQNGQAFHRPGSQNPRKSYPC